jgi:hypothetical protein
MTLVTTRLLPIRKAAGALLLGILGAAAGCGSDDRVIFAPISSDTVSSNTGSSNTVAGDKVAGNTTGVDLAVGGATGRLVTPVELVDDLFPVVRRTEIGGKVCDLKLTGTAVRKKIGLTFYKIGGYCEASACPTCADSLAAADVPKQLVLVMQRDISQMILEKSFAASFAENDPENKFTAESRLTLDHMVAAPMKKGQHVTITHLPGNGMTCQVGDGQVLHVPNPQFAHLVWNVYMGPKGVCPTLRSGLVTRLASAE